MLILKMKIRTSLTLMLAGLIINAFSLKKALNIRSEYSTIAPVQARMYEIDKEIKELTSIELWRFEHEEMIKRLDRYHTLSKEREKLYESGEIFEFDKIMPEIYATVSASVAGIGLSAIGCIGGIRNIRRKK